MKHLLRRSAPESFLTRDGCQALFERILRYTRGGGHTGVRIYSSSESAATWARNRTQIASDENTTVLHIVRFIHGAGAEYQLMGTDDDGLRHAVRAAETAASLMAEGHEVGDDIPYVPKPTLAPVLWSEATSNLTAGGCPQLAEALMAPTEAAGLLSAGELRVVTSGSAALDDKGLFQYYRTTEAQCSMTVRDQAGTASGWAGKSHYDLNKIDTAQLAARALDKAQRSAHPVAIEPGRYTTILEPQAMSDLMHPFVTMRGSGDPLDRGVAEQPQGPFGGRVHGTSKITERVVDARLMFSSDPMDPDGGFVPFDPGGTPFRAATWIDQGILRQMAYNKIYALARLHIEDPLPKPTAFRLAAAPGVPTCTVEEMVAKTERGVLVTRFSGMQLVDNVSMLFTGYTRDGLWLIEQGKITKPIKNFRFTESPLFILNNLEDVGTPERVFGPGGSYVAPPVRVRDFSFTSLADAV